jgi:hypothetical protein
MSSTKTQLKEVVDQLVGAGFNVAVFGGWAEELLGLSAPRAHEDIDLLIVNPNLGDLDAFVSSKAEVLAKRLSHKRAYITFGVLVELFLVMHDDGLWTTEFWDMTKHRWPEMAWEQRSGLPVAPATVLASYRSSYQEIHRNRNRPRHH